MTSSVHYSEVIEHCILNPVSAETFLIKVFNSDNGTGTVDESKTTSLSSGTNLSVKFFFYGCDLSKLTAVRMVRLCGLTRTVGWRVN